MPKVVRRRTDGRVPGQEAQQPMTAKWVAVLSTPEPGEADGAVLSAPLASAKPAHLARLASLPAQQTGGQIIIRRSTYALAGQTIAMRVRQFRKNK